MRVTKWILAFMTAVFAATPVLAADPPAGEFNLKTSAAGVKYITGGVGEVQAARMERRFGDYSFKLVNVRDGGEGAWVSNVEAAITNKSGKTVVQTTTEGPWLIADLQPGSYTVNTSFNGQTQSDEINISENGHERLVLSWNASDVVERVSDNDIAGASQVEAPEKVISTPAADAAAPPSQAPKTVVPGAKTETIYVSPEKARELKASGEAQPVSEHPGEAAGSEHPGNAVGQ